MTVNSQVNEVIKKFSLDLFALTIDGVESYEVEGGELFITSTRGEVIQVKLCEKLVKKYGLNESAKLRLVKKN